VLLLPWVILQLPAGQALLLSLVKQVVCQIAAVCAQVQVLAGVKTLVTQL
jgi:hypothetical protein